MGKQARTPGSINRHTHSASMAHLHGEQWKRCKAKPTSSTARRQASTKQNKVRSTGSTNRQVSSAFDASPPPPPTLTPPRS